MNRDICQAQILHPERIAAARAILPEPARVAAMADLFKLLGEGSRLRLLLALAAGEMCVCDLAAILEATPSAASHQLRLLRTAGLVRFRKEGKMAFYRLADARLRDLLGAGGHYLAAKGD